MSEYVKRGTERHSDLAEVMERRRSSKAQELENLEFDALIAEQKKKLKDASPETIDHRQTANFAEMLFAGRRPEEIKQILSTLTQEEIDRLAYIASSMNPNNFANLRGSLQAPNTSTKDIVEALKVGIELAKKPESNGFSAKDLLDAIKTGIEISKAQQPPVQQQQDPMAMYRMVQEIVQPFQQASINHERQMQELKMKDIEAKIVDPVAYVKNIKSVAADLGLTSSGAGNEFTLKKAEMDQTERLETKKLDWEMKKWELDKEKEGSTLDTVKQILEGPAGEILKSFGNAGAERLRGGGKANSNGQMQSQQIAKVKCPNCAGDFSANTQLSQIQCPLCGVQLQSGNQPAPQQEQQSSNSIPQEPVQQATSEPQ